MANRLTMAKVNAVWELHEQGWSKRRIAKTLGIDRKTVAEHLQEESAKRATAPNGSAPTGCEDSKRARAPTGSETEAAAVAAEPIAGALPPAPADVSLGESAAKPAANSAENSALAGAHPPGEETAVGRSDCEPFREIILAKLEQGLSAQRIHQDLVGEHQFAGKYWSVRRYVARLSSTRPLPFRRLEVGPGEEAQVDFGTGAPLVTADGRRRKTHVLRVVLSFSRKAYAEVVDRQTTENFIRALENAFHSFGGVPQRLVIDNLRAAVKQVDWFEPELNPKVRSFCEHYGVTILPTKPYTPRHKGKVERGVDYVQENALKGHAFDSLRAQNDHLRIWEATVADTRIHGTTRKQVGPQFRDVERATLRPLPTERFPCFEEAPRRVHRDGHVEVAKAYYSVPPEHLGHDVWVRWTNHTVRVFDGRMEQIALHARQEPGRFSTLSAHLAAEKICAVERGAEWLLTKVRRIGAQTTRWSEAMLAERGVAGVRVLQGLLSLTKRHRYDELERAAELAWRHQAYQLRTLRRLLERPGLQQQTFEFLDEHPLIRPLSEYGEFVQRSIQQSSIQGGI